MSSSNLRDPLVFLGGSLIVVADIAAIYLLTATPTAPAGLPFVMTVILGGMIGISYLYAASRHLTVPPDEPVRSPKAAAGQSAELIVSVTVIGPMSVVYGTLGGWLLEVIARLGGPDPIDEDERPWRNRLRKWRTRNREFMQSTDRKALPMRP